jgi:hypothetical protein
MIESVSKGTRSNVNGEVCPDLFEGLVDGLDHHVSIGLVGVIGTLLISIRVNASRLCLI